MLKKTFKKNDVERMRNLIKGKGGDATTTQVGYQKLYTKRVEGDEWEEDNQKWTIKDGIRQNITKLDSARKAHLPPLFCPNCNKIMKKRFDKDYYKIHKKCFDCVIEFETELKRIGAWEEYEKNIHNSEIDFFIKDYVKWVKDNIESETNNDNITESGTVEKWVGGINQESLLKELEKTIEHLEKMKR